MAANVPVLTWRRRMLPVAALLVLLNCVMVTGTHAQSPPVKNALVLNSYHQGYKWSDDVMSGIASVLGTSMRNVTVQTEYMDTQRIADDDYLLKLFEIYTYKFRDKRFDIIISSDDPAYRFLLKHRDKLFPATPIVFCGVNYHYSDTYSSLTFQYPTEKLCNLMSDIRQRWHTFEPLLSPPPLRGSKRTTTMAPLLHLLAFQNKASLSSVDFS